MSDIWRIKKFLYILVSIIAGLFTAGVIIDKGERWEWKSERKNYHKPYGFYEAVMKRPLDFTLSSLALVVFSPLLLVTGLLVMFKLGQPVIFTQERPGVDGKIFKIFKFRTMTDGRDRNGELLPDEKRLTGFGKKLRETSLDELPELVNIIRGDMAIIGPRPLLAEYLPRYNNEQKHRHDVRPGLTGLAQVRGRNEIGWKEKFKDDVEYVKKITFLGDVKILMETVGIVLSRTGISSTTSVTMEKFERSEEG